jgi:hypothetical protein
LFFENNRCCILALPEAVWSVLLSLLWTVHNRSRFFAWFEVCCNNVTTGTCFCRAGRPRCGYVVFLESVVKFLQQAPLVARISQQVLWSARFIRFAITCWRNPPTDSSFRTISTAQPPEQAGSLGLQQSGADLPHLKLRNERFQLARPPGQRGFRESRPSATMPTRASPTGPLDTEGPRLEVRYGPNPDRTGELGKAALAPSAGDFASEETTPWH